MADRSHRSSKPRKPAAERILEQILNLLDQGVVPWRKPWSPEMVATGGPCNLSSRHRYRGVNQILLSAHPCPYWLTYRQASAMGGFVRKGEKATGVLFAQPVQVDEDEDDGRPTFSEGTEPGKPPIWWAKVIPVFNLLQCDEIEQPEEAEIPKGQSLIRAREILDQARTMVPTVWGGQRAAYYPNADYVELPRAGSFDLNEEFFSTAFHEYAHATGHPSRLNRTLGTTMDDSQYAREELVAELSASMLCGRAGIAPRTIENSAAYIATWRGRLTDDPGALTWAAGQAQKAVDFLVGLADRESLDHVSA